LIVFFEGVVGLVKVGIDSHNADAFGTIGVEDLGLMNMIFEGGRTDDGIKDQKECVLIAEI
jgi:hypothetical protein